jgi:hypothetical protein
MVWARALVQRRRRKSKGSTRMGWLGNDDVVKISVVGTAKPPGKQVKFVGTDAPKIVAREARLIL